MHSSGGLRYEEADDAAWEGGRGAVAGAAKWGFYSAALGAIGYGISPIYRGLTIQFKVCQVARPAMKLKTIFANFRGMILGACLEADHRIREYEARLRMQKRMMRDRAAWEAFEKGYEEAPKK